MGGFLMLEIPANFQKLFLSWLNKAWPHRANPELAKVIKMNSGSGKNKYSASVQIVDPATLEETDTIIDDVGISPVWAGKKGQGIYAPIEAGMLVIVDFIQGNQAFPFISSVYGQEYGAGSFSTGEFLITDGTSIFKISAAGLFSIAGSACSLKEVLDDFLDAMASGTTIPAVTGSPLTFNPGTIASIQAAKAKLATVME